MHFESPQKYGFCHKDGTGLGLSIYFIDELQRPENVRPPGDVSSPPPLPHQPQPLTQQVLPLLIIHNVHFLLYN